VARRRGWGTVIAIAFTASSCGGPAVTAPATKSAPARGPVAVVLVGNSLAAQAAPDFDRLIKAAGATATNYVFGGTAVCDWLPTIRHVAATHPQAAVLEFVGSTFAVCMKGCPEESASAVRKYCIDMASAIGMFLAVGAHVFLAGTPIFYRQWVARDAHWDDLNRAFAALAAKHPGEVTYVDAGAAVEGSGGAFTWTLPCLATEPCTGPTVGGVRTDRVRAPDGVHFCPWIVFAEGCPGYNSGAFRFASAMATPVIEAFHLTAPTTRGTAP
jgi:hypothetical protein